MSINSRFTVAIHMLVLLSLNENKYYSSKFIAQSVNTNPVFIRRILSSLVKANLVTTQLGVEGGASLAQPAGQITLLDVYRATEPESLFTLHHSEPNMHCLCGRAIKPILGSIFTEAEMALTQVLAQTTLAEVKQQIQNNTL